MRRIQRAITFGLLLAAGTLNAQQASDPGAEEESKRGNNSGQLVADVTALTRNPHRLSGTAEYHEAADYVMERLKEIGVEKVLEQRFPTVQTEVEKCEISSADGRTVLPLIPLRPMSNIPPSTLSEGIRGEIIYLGKGGLEEFRKTEDVKGKIVVLDYNSGMAWYRAFRMGAAAIIIAHETGQSEEARAWNNFASRAPAALPRYYYEGQPDELLALGEGTIRAHIHWKRGIGRNIFAFIPGSNPKFLFDKPEVMLVAAPLDTFGGVPRRSPGARAAANAAGLLQLAERFQKDRPRRDVLLAFFDNTARGNGGSAAFYKIFESKKRGTKLSSRIETAENRRKFVNLLSESLSKDRPIQHENGVQDRLYEMVREKAAARTARIGYEQAQLRLRIRDLKRQDDEPDEQILEEINEQIDALQAEKDDWNSLRRYLGDKRAAQGLGDDPITDEVREVLERALDAVRVDSKEWAAESSLEMMNVRDDERISELLQDREIIFHASLYFGDSSKKWGIVAGGDSELRSKEDQAGLYSKLLHAFREGHERIQAGGTANEAWNFQAETVSDEITPPVAFWAPPKLVHSGDPGGYLGIYNFVFATAQESLRLEGTPDDVAGNLDMSAIAAQIDNVGVLLQETSSLDELSVRKVIKPYGSYEQERFSGEFRGYGPLVKKRSRGKALAEDPAAGTVIVVGNPKPEDFSFNPDKFYAYEDFYLVRANQTGRFSFGPEPSKANEEFQLYGILLDENGYPSYSTSTAGFNQKNADVFDMFPCRHGWMALPAQILPKRALVYDAKGNSQLQEKTGFYLTIDGWITALPEEEINQIKFFGSESVFALNVTGDVTRDAALEEIGDGFSIRDGWQALSSAEESAKDILKVNQARLDLLKNRGIGNSSLEEIHGQNTDKANKVLTDVNSSLEREALLTAAYLKEREVYRRSLNTIKDLVTAVLLLLLLAVPFSFAMERLLVGATNIYRQVIWFGAFFVASFLALFFSHPAFAISATPLVIFLGFVILVLSSLVILIIMQKFEVELKYMQGLSSTVHSADVSRFSTIMAAMAMGISTMRRRPLRTALTAVTILLLTFTILSFASFGQQVAVVKLPDLPSPNYSGSYVHRITWKALDKAAVDVVEGRWGEEFLVAERYWMTPETLAKGQPAVNQGFVVSSADRENHIVMRGLLGMELEEMKARDDLRSLLTLPTESGKTSGSYAWLTEAAAERLGVARGDEIFVGGSSVTVAGFPERRELITAVDMDGSSLLPADLSSFEASQGESEGGEESVNTSQSWNPLPIDSVLIVTKEVAERAGADLRGILVYTEDNSEAGEVAEELTSMFSLPVSGTRRDGVYWHVFGSVLQASGVKDLIFPILLGGLVIFGTMLGSVADREREIYTFSALGLAPTHVASLFFAEAMVFSVIGGFGGYLFAQISMKFLEFLAEFGWVVVPEMNHSSMNAIITIIIVMLTVLASSIYPALKASRSANPGVMRGWKLPPAKNDTLDLTFPFTVSAYDFTGVVSFLKEHFDNFQDTSLGVFMALDTELIHEGKDKLGLRSKVALAPFDLGVTQDFQLTSAPSEIPGIDEVRIILKRESGQPKDWERLNKNLLDDLRKQFLIWRSLPAETMENYRQETLEKFGRELSGEALGTSSRHESAGVLGAEIAGSNA